MIEDVLLDMLEELWETKYKDLSIKIAIAAPILGGGAFAYKKVMSKTFYKRLNKKIHDCYNPLDLTKHVWISGVQGSGKSNKLRRIFINTFVKQGYGGIYIDTHGTADEILLSIPPDRWKDVIYIAPWMGRVYGINVLQRYSNSAGEIDRIAEDIVDVFHKMYPRSWGDKLANCIRFATKAVLIAEENNPNYNNPTLIDIYRVLKDSLFRENLFQYVDNDIIEDFFENLKATNAINKLENPLSSDNIMAFLCQKQGFNMYEAMENNKIIICNFDKNELSENANLMAGIILSIIAKCAAKRKESEPHPFFAIAADEFYEYANKHINVLIEQMRKKNVCLLLANQHRDQLPQQVQSAVSMCQSKFIHTPSDSDLNWVSNIYRKWFTKEEIISIPFYYCIQDAHISGKARAPYITPVPMYKGDYDWEYAHKLKFASLHFAPERWKVLEELKRSKNDDVFIKSQEPINNTGIIEYEAENQKEEEVVEEIKEYNGPVVDFDA